MAIPDADPRAKELDAAFEAAVNGPAKPRAEAKTPAEVDHDAPFGRAEDGTPLAPHGLTKDGRPRRTAGGRPRKDDPDRARTGEQPEAPDEGKRKPEPHDWTAELDGLGDAVWFGMSAAAKAGPKIPLIGKRIPEQKLAAQAFILSETKPQLVAAVNLAAQHNARAEAFCRRLEGGDGLWALSCMFMVMPVISISLTVWKADEKQMAAEQLPSLAEMARRNNAKMDEAVAKISAQIAAATAAAAVQAEQEPAGA